MMSHSGLTIYRVGSKKNGNLIFPRDPEKQRRMKDTDAEIKAVGAYWQCTNFDIMSALHHGDPRRIFYRGLFSNVGLDYEAVLDRLRDLEMSATPLGLFEFR